MIGRVVSTKMKSTAVVLVASIKVHPLYKKAFARSKKYLADDRIGVKEGDMVDMIKIKPISKNKHWQIAKVVGRDITEIVEEQLKHQAAEVIEEVMPEEKTSEEGKMQSEKSEQETKKPAKRIRKGVKE